MTFDSLVVLLALVGMLAALVKEVMRPGMILFTVTAVFL